MSLNKAIQSGKEYRKPYTGAKRYEREHRNHGSCDYCKNARLFRAKRRAAESEYELSRYRRKCGDNDGI